MRPPRATLRAFRVVLDTNTVISALVFGGGTMAALRRAWQDARCLACHSTPQSVYKLGSTQTDLSDAAAQLRIEGVSCDACHTQAGRPTDDWKLAHTDVRFRNESYTVLGMKWINDLPTRVTMCAGCHVGAPAEPGIPARNMNHDMIAAGHPRLNWDYATYSDALPPHWQEYDRKDRSDASKAKGRGPDWNLQMWFEGEVHSTVAALDLTADRAKGPSANDPARPWPELAESNCFMCHHDLVPKAWDDKSPTRYKAMKARFPELKPGSNLWLSSAYSLPLQKLTAGDPSLSQKHRDFVLLMSSKSSPDPVVVQKQATALRTDLLAWAGKSGPTLTQEILRKALEEASKEEYLLWDECVQIYNATRPILLTQTTGGAKPKEGVKRWNLLGDLLELPRDGKGNTWNSPRLRVLEGDKLEPEFDKEFSVQPSARELMEKLFEGLTTKR